MKKSVLEFRVSKAEDNNYQLDAKCGKNEAGYPPVDDLTLVKIIVEMIRDWKLKKNKRSPQGRS